MGSGETRLLSLLSHGAWTSSADLARALGVTSRTVRNYVSRLNAAAEDDDGPIESSPQGYRLRASQRKLGKVSESSTASYRDELIRHLIGVRDPINIYDLADLMHISDSSLTRALREAREFVEPFGLKITRVRDRIKLVGHELDKRRLIASLLANGSPQNFLEFAKSSMLSQPYDAASIARDVEQALSNNGLTCNDYELNNIVLHVVIMTDRADIETTFDPDSDLSAIQGTSAWNAAYALLWKKETETRTSSRLDGSAGSDVLTQELYHLALVIASNSKNVSNLVVNEDNLSDFIDPRAISISEKAVHNLEDTYCLDPFDESFTVRLAIHVNSLIQRARQGSYVRNPLTHDTKRRYPLYYDMAVFMANQFAEGLGISLNEDEIAFLSFHIGGYFESQPLNALRITCTFLYLGYHDLHQDSLERVRRRLGDRITIVNVASVVTANLNELDSDIVISPVAIDAPNAGSVVVVDPFISDRDLVELEEAVRHAQGRKRSHELLGSLHHFLVPQLFKRNFYADSPEQMITKLVSDCVDLGFCAPSFRDDVLSREALSPTAFGNRLAAPHSMTPSAYRSFLSFVVNDRPMLWGEQEVNVIMLIGMGEMDRASFRLLFDSLLETLGDQSNVMSLIGCTDYDDFAQRLLHIILSL